MGKYRIPVFLVCLLFLPFLVFKVLEEGEKDKPESETLPSTYNVLKRYIEAVGGREALEKLDTRVCRGKLINDLSWHNPPREEIPFEFFSTASGKLLMVEHQIEGDRYEGCDGKVSWVMEPRRGANKIRKIWNKFAWLLHPHNALQIKDFFPNLKVKSKKKVEHKEVYVMEAEGMDPLYHTLYFETATGLLCSIGHYWEIQDYREVDGIKFPFKIVIGRKGGSSAYAFAEVKHNVPIDESIFTFPQKKSPGE